MNSGMVSSGATNVVAALLEQRTGQQISSNRAWRLETALGPVLRAHGMASVDDLIGRILGGSDPTLSDKVVDALLNQETSFFRDAQVCELVVEAAQQMADNAPGRRLRIWSAGCSTGQEPFSLAMQFAERAKQGRMLEPEILATDVSRGAIARAKAGRFSQFEIQRGLPIRRMIEWFDEGQGEWIAKPELIRKVQFRRHNLAMDPPPAGKYDIVLCRNVMLYFSLEMRRRVFDGIARAMRPNGLLVLGAGETVIGQTECFEPATDFRGLYRALGPAPESPMLAVG